MKAVRALEKKPYELEAGEYTFMVEEDSDPPGRKVWYCSTPNGLIGCLMDHVVVENDDDTITVSPSIWANKDRTPDWHGYLERDVWLTVDKKPVKEAQ